MAIIKSKKTNIKTGRTNLLSRAGLWDLRTSRGRFLTSIDKNGVKEYQTTSYSQGIKSDLRRAKRLAPKGFTGTVSFKGRNVNRYSIKTGKSIKWKYQGYGAGTITFKEGKVVRSKFPTLA